MLGNRHPEILEVEPAARCPHHPATLTKGQQVGFARDHIRYRATAYPSKTITAVEATRQIVDDRKDRGGRPWQTVVLCNAMAALRNVGPCSPSPVPCRCPKSDRIRKRTGRETTDGGGSGRGTIYGYFLGSFSVAPAGDRIPPRSPERFRRQVGSSGLSPVPLPAWLGNMGRSWSG